ncbi:MAG: hypothetical protein SNJ75_15955 [Gemmataceae bacterium]
MSGTPRAWPGPVAAEPVQHRRGGHAVVLAHRPVALARVVLEDVVPDRVAGRVEDDAVNGILGEQT